MFGRFWGGLTEESAESENAFDINDVDGEEGDTIITADEDLEAVAEEMIPGRGSDGNPVEAAPENGDLRAGDHAEDGSENQTAGAGPAPKKRKNRTDPGLGRWVAFVCFDVEVAGSSRAVHEICQLGAALFRVQKPDGTHIDCDVQHCEYVQPSTKHVWDEGLGGTGTHGITPGDVRNAMKYPQAIDAFCNWMKTSTEELAGEQLEDAEWAVCLVAHSGKATDFDWIAHLNARYKSTLPPWVQWCWDTLPASKLAPEFKVTRGMSASNTAAPRGNTSHGLAELYRAITGSDMADHHDAGADAKANVCIAKALFRKRVPVGGGMQSWIDFNESKQKAIKQTRELLRPDLSDTPWSYVEGEQGNSGMPPPTGSQPRWGPKGRAAAVPDKVEDYFLMFWDVALETMATWTNCYAAEQPVKILGRSKNRVRYTPCDLGSPGQQWRCGTAEDKLNWEPTTKWEIAMVFAVLMRGAAKRCRSILELWSNYDDVGDPLVRDHCCKSKFLRVLRYIACCDYTTLERGPDGSPTKLCKIKPIMDIVQRKFRDLFDMSQAGCIDEATATCKSRYCGIKQRNAQKPKRIHIKVYCLGCAETAYLCAFSVYGGKGSGTLAEIVCDQLMPTEYSGHSKIVTMDNYFTGHDVTHGLFAKHKAYHVGTVSLRARQDKSQAAISHNHFPFRAVSQSVADAVPRGFVLSAKATVDCPEQGMPYEKHAKLVKDTKLIGLTHNAFTGLNATTVMTRRLRAGNGVKDTEVGSCEALIWYLATYGTIDTIDASTEQYPIDLRASGHWYRRLLYWLIDVSLHNAFVILNFNMGNFDGDDPVDRVARQGVCYCQDSKLKKHKRHSIDQHKCYFNRSGLSARLKFHKDIARALMLRADEELQGAMRPGKRGRKRRNPDTPGSAAPAPKRRMPCAIRHGEGHHQFKQGMALGRCIVCQYLKSKNVLKHAVRQVTTGCSNCSVRRPSKGVRVCIQHWDSEIGEAMHSVGFNRQQCNHLDIDSTAL